MRVGLAMAVVLAGCASVGPRFDPVVAASFQRQPMRVMRTAEAEIYYPEAAKPAAEAMAARMGECVKLLREKVAGDQPVGRALIFLTSANFNNAYVTGQSGGEPLHTVDPLFTSSEVFHWYGFAGTHVGDIGCHELFHYVHYEQVEGLWKWVNLVLGDVVPPQDFLERWFTEGVAQYYEGRLGKRVGRPHSPLYRASFEAGVASRGGRVTAADLSSLQRELLPSSGAYLGSLHFVEFLARRSGDAKLWELMTLQGRSIFSPLGVALRFKSVYGASLGALVDEWSAALEQAHVERPPSPGAVTLRDTLGFAARLAVAPDGTVALVTQGLEEPGRLRLFEADGTLRAEVRLVQLAPDREWITAGPMQMSGLSFTADSKWLWLMNDDFNVDGEDRAHLWKVDARSGDTVQVVHGLGGRGGAIAPDGSHYVWVATTPGKDALTSLDLRTQARTELASFADAVGGLAYAPDGHALAFSKWTGDGFDLFVRESNGDLRQLTFDGRSNYGVRWVNERQLLFAREHEGRLQGHLIDAAGGAATVVTRAPFSAFDLASRGDQVLWLDKRGWGWALVSAPMQPFAEVAETARTEPEPVPAPLAVENDEPYSAIDHLFYPQLRLPGVDLLLACPSTGCTLFQRYGLLLAGKDRLSFHAWALAASLALPTKDFSVSGGYVNSQLAPWSISADASYDQYGEAPEVGPIREVAGRLAASRSIFSVPLGFSLSGFHREGQGRTTRFIGPAVGFDYFAGESTPYQGLRRGFGFGAGAALYPKGLGSQRDLFDLQVTALLAVPLPFSTRHSFVLSFAGRTVEGAPDGALLVGGLGRGGYTLFSNGDTYSNVPGPNVPLPRRFAMGVRGYEDFGVRTSRALTAQAVYRYPFIIDAGWASILWVLPSFFVRQIDVEAFGAAALIEGPQNWLRSAGAAISLRTVLGGSFGLSLFYRFAYRFDFGLPPLHAITFGFE